MKMNSLAQEKQVQIIRLLMLLTFILLLGTMGYHFLLGWGWVESLYMTVITITTVGYGEVNQMDGSGRIFTIFLVLISVGSVAYAASTLTSLVMQTEIRTLFWKRRMEQKIKELTNHYIVCGFGRTGKSVSEFLSRSRLPFLVVEGQQERANDVVERGYVVVEGDASTDECLERAGISRAKGLVAALGGDAENVYLVLSARQFNPNLTIVSWASSQEAEKKIRRAGANHVISPYVMGGQRIARMLTTPHALEFFDHAMDHGGEHDIRLAEFDVNETSRLVGNSIKGLGIGRNLGVILMGIRRMDGKMIFNPSADTEFMAGDILIGIGSESQLEAFRKILK